MRRRMITNLLLTTLSTYGLAYIITTQDGMFNIFVRLRRYKLFQCFYCVSPYIAALVSLLCAQEPMEWLLLTLATVWASYIVYELVSPL